MTKGDERIRRIATFHPEGETVRANWQNEKNDWLKKHNSGVDNLARSFQVNVGVEYGISLVWFNTISQSAKYIVGAFCYDAEQIPTEALIESYITRITEARPDINEDQLLAADEFVRYQRYT